MNKIRTRTGSLPAAYPNNQRPHGARRLLSKMLHATLGKLTLPQREPPPAEYYRFPWF